MFQYTDGCFTCNFSLVDVNNNDSILTSTISSSSKDFIPKDSNPKFWSTDALYHFSAALCLCFSKDLLSYVCSVLRHEIYASRTFTLDKVCNKRSFTDLLFFSAVTALASASYSREFRDLSTTAQASALLAVVSCITSICLKRGLEDSGTWVIDSLRWRSPAW